MTGAGQTMRDVQGMPFICLPTERVMIYGKEVKVPAYCMAKTETTVKDYFRIMPQDRSVIQLPEGFDGSRQPMANVDWFHAKRFCEKIGGTLPTEDQWYRAVLGPRKGYGDVSYYATNDGTLKCGVNAQCDTGQTADVGSFADGPFGFKDLTGNVWEWQIDKYSRGGSYDSDVRWGLRAGGRDIGPPGLSNISVGFRCAVPPQPATESTAGKMPDSKK